jgi:hypothetical protein
MLDFSGSERYGTVMERIERDTFYEPNSGCWLYAGPVDEKGYGRIRIGGKKLRVHNATFRNDKRPLAKDQLVMHSCDMPCCWNPEHLSAGTNKENRQDAMVKGRIPKGEESTQAKLTNDIVAEIRASSETHRALGERYGVSHNVIGKIKRYEKWRHLP